MDVAAFNRLEALDIRAESGDQDLPLDITCSHTHPPTSTRAKVGVAGGILARARIEHDKTEHAGVDEFPQAGVQDVVVVIEVDFAWA